MSESDASWNPKPADVTPEEYEKQALEWIADSASDCNTTYETKWIGPTADPPPWVDIPQFVGKFMEKDDATIRMEVVEEGRLDRLRRWLNEE